MEEAKETKEGGEKGCCATTKKCCCGGKALAAVGLVAIGFAGGFFCSRACPVKNAPAAQTQSK